MKRITSAILAAFMGLVMLSVPMLSAVNVFAASSSCVKTTVLGGDKCKEVHGELEKSSSGTINCSCDDGEGSSMIHILKLIVEIMTIGIGILGVIGITVVGIQYLTAGGSEEKTRKAKRRMFEIIIGLVAYVLIYALMQWLIPDFHPFS